MNCVSRPTCNSAPPVDSELRPAAIFATDQPSETKQISVLPRRSVPRLIAISYPLLHATAEGGAPAATVCEVGTARRGRNREDPPHPVSGPQQTKRGEAEALYPAAAKRP